MEETKKCEHCGSAMKFEYFHYRLSLGQWLCIVCDEIDYMIAFKPDDYWSIKRRCEKIIKDAKKDLKDFEDLFEINPRAALKEFKSKGVGGLFGTG